MNDKAINFEAELGQSSKGYWYAKNIKIAASNIFEFKQMMYDAMVTTEDQLYHFNNKAEDQDEDSE